jgi:diguanylate cyclase (GGDEF)-like protein/PAS domain S-box-containing protein
VGLIGGIGQWRLRSRLALLLTVVGTLTVGTILADQRIAYQAVPGLQIGILASAALIGIAIGWGFLQRAAATVERLPLLVAVGLITSGAAEFTHSLDRLGILQDWWGGSTPTTLLASRLMLAGLLVAGALSTGETICDSNSCRAPLFFGASLSLGVSLAVMSRYTVEPPQSILTATAIFLAVGGVLLIQQYRKDRDEATWGLVASLVFNIAALVTLVLVEESNMLGADVSALMVTAAYVVPVLGLGASHFKRIEEAEEDLGIMRTIEDRFHNVVEYGSYPIVSIDEAGIVDYANLAASELLGYEADELVGIDADRMLVEQSLLLTDPKPRHDLPIAIKVERLISDKSGKALHVELAMSSSMIRGHRFTTWLIRDLSEQMRAEQALSYQATHDELTSLLNRKAIVELLTKELQSRRAKDGRVAVLFVDLDRFKAVNDRLGHDAGDLLLRETAKRTIEAVRSNDLVARLGGDEFIILCRDVQDVADVVAVAERVVETLSSRFDLDGREAFVAASVGIAISGSSSRSAGELIDQADAALYRAKERGRARWELFDESMQEWAATQQELASALGDAIENGELEVWYQPIVNLLEERLLGFEALVRWRRPSGQLLSPDQFVETAESSGLIVPLGRWVLETVARQIVTWDAAFPGNDLYITTNVSGRQLMEPTVVNTMIEDVERAGVDPARITLELTETILLDDTESTLLVLNRLKQSGFRIAVDDFGTGYSSLTYLRTFPIDVVKIDRSFVTPLCGSEEDSTIVATIIALANALNLSVVAEGIEDRDTAAKLLGLRCKVGQGYYFGRPTQPSQVEELFLRDALTGRTSSDKATTTSQI